VDNERAQKTPSIHMYLRRIPLRLTVVAAATAAVMSVHAEQVQPTSGKADAKPGKAAADTKIQKVEVRGSAGAYDPRRDDTASKIVVNHEEIVKYGDTSVLDVLKRLPGVTVSGAGGRGGEVRMRGLGSGYTQVLINGERAPAGFAIDSLAPDVIERIEVLRAASAEFSTQSIAGTINIILKKAIKTAQRELKAGLGGARAILSPNLNLQLSDRAGTLSYSLSLNAFYNHQKNQSRTVEEGRDPGGRQTLMRNTGNASESRFGAINFAPRLNWALENGDTLTSQSFLNLNRYSGASESQAVTVLGARPLYPNIDAGSVSRSESARSDLTWVHQLQRGAQLDLKFGLSRNANRNESHQIGFDQPAVYTLDRRVVTNADEQGYSYTGKYTTPIVEGHSLAAGWEGGTGKRAEDRTQREAALAGAKPFNVDEDFSATVKRLALYAQDEWNVTQRWSVYLGARWEGIDTRSSGSELGTVDSRTSVWSPLFHTLWKLPDSKGDQVRLAVTRTYKAPPTARLIARRFVSTNNSQVEPDYQGNPKLRPELALGVDASYEHYWGEGALLSVSTSMRRIDGYIRNGLVTDDDGRWVSLPLNAGNAVTRGLELEAKFPLKSVMDHAPAIDLRASFSRNWSSVDSVPGPDNRLDQQTPLSATLGVDYKGSALSAGGSFAFRSGGPTRISLNESSYSTVRRDLEAYVVWKFDPKNQLRVAAYNLLKHDWISQSTYANDDGSLRRTSVNPGRIYLRATMEMKF
jgi:outer membrane receptor for ferrienterochelin and colicins